MNNVFRSLIFITGFIIVFVTATSLLIAEKRMTEQELISEKIELGREIFFDKDLSNPEGQSCAVCHSPRTMFADPNNAVISEGMVDGRFVNRNSMTLMYTRYIPELHRDEKDGLWRGGLFWDGRSNSLEHQLSGPFFNPAEMNNADTAMLAEKFRKTFYYKRFKKAYGRTRSDTELYNQIIDALAAFERSEMFHPFTSKFDYYLEGKVALSDNESRGFEIIKNNCTPCHSTEPQGADGRILFTDYSYHNIGVPRNESNPFYTTDSVINPHGVAAIDYGLGEVLKNKDQLGKFRVPSLRDVAYTWPYFHNGIYESLEDVIRFKSTRNSAAYTGPEVAENLERIYIGQMNLSDNDIACVVEFLHALSDGYELPEE